MQPKEIFQMKHSCNHNATVPIAISDDYQIFERKKISVQLNYQQSSTTLAPYRTFYEYALRCRLPSATRK